MDKRRHLATETGLYTPDVFEVLLNYETTRIKRYPGPLALLHLALGTDDYPGELRKQAHEAMTSLLNRTLRASDVPSHYHNEFLILLPATDEEAARTVAERILSTYRTTPDLAGRTASAPNVYVGLTSQNGGSILSPQHLLAEAAAALDEARLSRSSNYVAYSDLAREKPGGQ